MSPLIRISSIADRQLLLCDQAAQQRLEIEKSNLHHVCDYNLALASVRALLPATSLFFVFLIWRMEICNKGLLKMPGQVCRGQEEKAFPRLLLAMREAELIWVKDQFWISVKNHDQLLALTRFPSSVTIRTCFLWHFTATQGLKIIYSPPMSAIIGLRLAGLPPQRSWRVMQGHPVEYEVVHSHYRWEVQDMDKPYLLYKALTEIRGKQEVVSLQSM